MHIVEGHLYLASSRLPGNDWETKPSLEQGEFPTTPLVEGQSDHEFLLGTNRRLIIWQSQTGSIREVLRSIYPVLSVRFSRQNNVAAVMIDDGHTRLVDLASGQTLGSFPVQDMALSPSLPEGLLIFPKGTENLVTHREFRRPGQLPVYSQPVDDDDFPAPAANAAYLSGGEKFILATPDHVWIYRAEKLDETFASVEIPESDSNERPPAITVSESGERFALVMRVQSPFNVEIEEFLIQVFQVPAQNPHVLAMPLKPEFQIRLERPLTETTEPFPPVAFTEHRFLVGVRDGVAVFNLDRPQQQDSFAVGEKIWNLQEAPGLNLPPSPMVALASGSYHGYFAAARADGRVMIWGSDHNHMGGGERGVVTEPLPGVVQSLHFKIGTHQALWASVRKPDGSYAYFRFGTKEINHVVPATSP